jgi:hypothetical protein
MLGIVHALDILAPFAGGFAALFLYVVYSWRPIQLLRRTIYRGMRFHGYPHAFARVVRFITLGVSREATFDAACLWIEMTLLNPANDERTPRERARDAKDQLNRLVGIARDKRDKRDPVIEVETCFDLYQAEDDIDQYFKARAAANNRHRSGTLAFRSKVSVADGFVAPLHLISGLVAHFKEDWRPVIRDYTHAVETTPEETQTVISADTRAFQAFLFRCWLLWGPSVPIGTCRPWSGGKLVQFGYGDENNSIALLIPEDGKPAVKDLFRPTEDGHPTLAVPAEVVGTIQRGLTDGPHEVCPVQRSGIVADDYKRIVIVRPDVHPHWGIEEDQAPSYYSAYIWVAFVLCDEAGVPVYQNERWRNLLTFFEHGNLAEQNTYEAMKHQLAAKVTRSLESILRWDKHITVHYACAIDDCGCGHKIVCPSPEGRAIKDVLFQHTRRMSLQRWDQLDSRVRSTPPVSPHNCYAASQLPQMVKEYLDSTVKEQTNGDHLPGPDGFERGPGGADRAVRDDVYG